MKKKKQLKIAINAQIFSKSGGIEQAVIGLVFALGKLKDGNERYFVITHPQNPGWLNQYIGKNTKIIVFKQESLKQRLKAEIIALAEKNRFFGKVAKFFYQKIRKEDNFSFPKSNGFFESMGINVLHFPFQQFIESQIPSIFCPIDLQHLHFPQFFSASQVKKREFICENACKKANVIGVSSKWTKNDVAKQYRINLDKIFNIPFGPPTVAYKEITQEIIKETKNKFCLPKNFIFYPAQTWPHKNHIRLLEALAFLRDKKEVKINLVCCGNKTDFWPAILAAIKKLKLESYVKFLDFVQPQELKSFYKLSCFVVLPTLFEAGCLPMLEAFEQGVPVACSNVTCLPEQAGNAALLFNPYSIEDMAEAIYKMNYDKKLRKKLAENGKKRIKQFTWKKNAKTYRALYRKLAGADLSAEDKKLLKESLS